MALSKEEQEQLKAAGHDLADIEGAEVGPDLTESGDSSNTGGQDPQTQQSGQDQTVEATQDAGQDQQDAEATEQPEEGQRRTWQGQIDKEKAAREAAETARQQAEQERNAAMQLLSQLGDSGSGSSPQPQQVAQPEKEPTLYDFIDKSEYSSLDANDPGTASGIAYQQWQGKLHEYRTAKSLLAYEQRQAEQRRTQTAQTQAKALAKAYHEFRRPFSEEPDMQKVANFVDTIAQSDDPELWAKLYAAINGEQTTNNGSQQTPVGTQAIGRKAGQVRSVGTQSASGPTEPKKVPKMLQEMQKQYGADFELPLDADFGD